MTEFAAAPAAPAPAAPAPAPASPQPAPAPAAAAPSPAAPVADQTPATPAPAPAAALRPPALPEKYWDGTLGAINTKELLSHFEGQAALKARKPEDIKLLDKLPDDFKLPENTTWKVNEKDPWIPIIRQIAVEEGLPQETVTKIMLADARLKRDSYVADQQALKDYETAENTKLGDNATARKEAVLTWIEKAPGFEPSERLDMAMSMTSAAKITWLEKVIQKITGGVPMSASGTPASPEPAKPEKTIAQRLYPNMASASDVRKAG